MGYQTADCCLLGCDQNKLKLHWSILLGLQADSLP